MGVKLGYPIDDLLDEIAADDPARLRIPSENCYDWFADSGEAKEFLEGIQANILRGHVRDHAYVLILQFGPSPALNRQFLSRLSKKVKSAADQLRHTGLYHLSKLNRTSAPPLVPLVNVMLSYTGYTAIDAVDHAPTRASFVGGMEKSQIKSDGPKKSWQKPWNDKVDAVLLIAGPASSDDTINVVDRCRLDVLDLINQHDITVTGEEYARSKHRRSALGDKEGVEAFGFVDGISQPLYFTSQIRRAAKRYGVDLNDPAASLGTVLVSEPTVTGPQAYGSGYGSFAVLRKLDQDLAAFDAAVANISAHLGIGTDLAAATMVGRFRDGVPLVLYSRRGRSRLNNFNYDRDSTGYRCPLSSHVRKMNQRLPDPIHNASAAGKLRPVIARRGMFYDSDEAPEGLIGSSGYGTPNKEVGLLFLAFQADIDTQFRLMQHWIDSDDAPFPGGGRDLLLAGGASVSNAPWRLGKPSRPGPCQVGRIVNFKGGEYLFAPSLVFLRSLARV